MSKRDSVYKVELAGEYPGEVETWFTQDDVNVLATGAEDAIVRAKSFIDARDKKDRDYKDRVSLIVNGVSRVCGVDVT